MTFFQNKLLLGCVIILSFFCFLNTVSASSLNLFPSAIGVDTSSSDGKCGAGSGKCQAILGDPSDVDCPAYWLQWILNVMKYVAIAALIVLSMVDFIKATVSNDKDALKKAGVTAAKRFCFAVILFFLPIIIDYIMSLFGAYGTCGIE